MSHIVRRADGNQRPASIDLGEYDLPVTRQDHELSVTTSKSLEVQPRIKFEWNAPYELWNKGCKLYIFHNTVGFAPNRDTLELSDHGHLIFEETANGMREELVGEGTHFYTLILYKPVFVFFESRCVVRFSETIPSAKVAIGRMEDLMKLKQLTSQHYREDLNYQVAENDAATKLFQSQQKMQRLLQQRPDDGIEFEIRKRVEPIVRQALIKARTKIEVAMQWDRIRSTLKKDEGWKSLKREKREQILQEIAADLDSDEAEFQP